MTKITARQIAAQTGVSIATVSRTINNNGYVHADVRARIEAAMRDLGYLPNQAARNLATGRTRTVGLVLQTLHSPAFVDMTEAIQMTLREKGYFLLMCNTQFNQQIETDYLRLVQSGMLDGMITNAINDTATEMRQLVQQNYPIVFINRSLTGIEGQPTRTGFVQMDLQHATFLATDYLAGLGHRRIGVMTGDMQLSTQQRRLGGYREALQARGLEFDPLLVRAVAVNRHEAVEAGQLAPKNANALHEATVRATGEFLTAIPDVSALIVIYHTMLPGVLQAIRQVGRRVPDDLSLVAFSDFPMAPFLDPPLTVVAQPSTEMGHKAADMLVALIEQPSQPAEHVLLRPELIVRQSCKPYP